jgi:hypothetical protein
MAEKKTAKKIVYSEPVSYFPPSIRKQFMNDAKTETAKKSTGKKTAKKGK